MLGLSGCLNDSKRYFGHDKNEFIFYKNENYSNYNESPKIQDLMADKNVKHAIIHDTNNTVYVGHNDEGKTFYGTIKHQNKEDADNFINKGLPLFFSGNNNRKQLTDY